MYDPKKRLSKYIFIAAFIILGYLAFLLVKPFLGAVIISMIVAYTLIPFHKKLAAKIKSPNTSAAAITIFLIVAGVAFFIFFVNLLINEAVNIYQTVNVSEISSVVRHYIPSDKVDQYVSQFIDKGAGTFLSFVSSFAMSIPEKILLLLISICTIFFALRDNEKLKSGIMQAMPVSEQYKKKITERFGHTVDAVIYSMVFVSIAQGIVATIGFYLFGVSTPLLWGFITTVFAMLPFVGPATVWAPVSAYLLFTGRATAAFGLAIFCLLFVTILLDMVWKPKLIAEKGKIHPLIAILGVLGGFSVFGFSGIILGPFVLSLFIFVLSVLLGKESLKLQD